MKHIPIAYATEKDYVDCTIVSMISAVDTAYSDTFYDFYILVDIDFPEECQCEIMDGLQKYASQCCIEFKKISGIFDNAYLHLDFIKKPTYFRLLLPDLLTEEKCIYLDSDTIICTDLQRLFDTQMSENYIAGVKAPGYIIPENEVHRRQALLLDMRQYINAGVLLMNLKQLRKDNVVKKFLEYLPLNMDAQDQDIINSVCYDKIMFLAFEFNVMTKYATWGMSDYSGIFSETELKRAWNAPQIIHYADRVKPWKNLNCAMGDYWWNICKKSCVWKHYEKIPNELIFGTIYSAGIYTNQITAKKEVALFDLFFERKIVIYGAGNRAQKFIMYLRDHNIDIQFVCVSDKYGNPNTLNGIIVKELDEVVEDISDKTIIIATQERYHAPIISLLQKYKLKEIVPLSDTWK